MSEITDLSLQDVEEKLDALRDSLTLTRFAETAAADALEVARKRWEDENDALIRAAKIQKEARVQAEEEADALMLRYHELSGKKSYKGTFEVRMKPTPEFDPLIVKKWLLSLLEKNMVVDTGAFKTFVGENFDGENVLATVPATIVQKTVPAILSKGLAAPDKKEPQKVTVTSGDSSPASQPVAVTVTEPTIEKVGEPVSFYTAPIEAIVEVVNSSAKAVASLPVAEKPFDALGDIPF